MEKSEKISNQVQNENVEKNAFKKTSELTREEILNFPKCKVDLQVIKRKNSDIERYSYEIQLGSSFRLNDNSKDKKYLSYNEFNSLTLKLIHKVNHHEAIIGLNRPYRLVKGVSPKNGKEYFAVQVWFTMDYNVMIFLKYSEVEYLESLMKAGFEKTMEFAKVESLELFTETGDEVGF